MESWAIKKFINHHIFKLIAAWLKIREAYETEADVNPLDDYYFSMAIMELDRLCDEFSMAIMELDRLCDELGKEEDKNAQT